MLDELICVTRENGKVKFSISKLLARLTYFAGGFGIGLGVKAFKK